MASLFRILCIALQTSFITANQLSLKSWMHQLETINAGRRITAINIPGTHESMATRGGDWAVCNVYTITQQLNMGYRFFDIRVKWRNNELGIYHGPISMQQTWDDLHQQLVLFFHDAVGAAAPPISAHECVILKVKDQGGSKPGKFARNFAAAITAYNTHVNNRNHIYYFRRTNQIKAPTLTRCAGKAVILHDGAWGLATPWRHLYPWMWVDENPGKGDDKTTWTAHHRSNVHASGRIVKWRDAMVATQNAQADPHATKFWRNGINANSKSRNIAATQGNPKQWARIMNPRVYNYIRGRSFPAGNVCVPRFYGGVAIDIPTAQAILMRQQIAIVIILSNCALYNWVNVAKNFNNFPVLVAGVVAAHSVESNVMKYDYEEEENELDNDKKFLQNRAIKYKRKRFNSN
eukprot:433209_1